MATQSASAQPAKSSNPLAIYLNDHLAGSAAALDLLGHLQHSHCNTPIGQFAAELKKEIFEDRQKLQLLMLELNIRENRVRQAGTWFLDQLFKWKTELEDRDGGAFGLLEILESVAIGIDGKIALWTALGEVAKGTPEIAKLDYAALKERARHQRERIEGMRLSAAIDALRFPPPRIAPNPSAATPAPVSTPLVTPPPADDSAPPDRMLKP